MRVHVTLAVTVVLFCWIACLITSAKTLSALFWDRGGEREEGGPKFLGEGHRVGSQSWLVMGLVGGGREGFGKSAQLDVEPASGRGCMSP